MNITSTQSRIYSAFVCQIYPPLSYFIMGHVCSQQVRVVGVNCSSAVHLYKPMTYEYCIDCHLYRNMMSASRLLKHLHINLTSLHVHETQSFIYHISCMITKQHIMPQKCPKRLNHLHSMPKLMSQCITEVKWKEHFVTVHTEQLTVICNTMVPQSNHHLVFFFFLLNPNNL